LNTLTFVLAMQFSKSHEKSQGGRPAGQPPTRLPHD